jgi:acetolactate synthase-1/2/3 large subunit
VIGAELLVETLAAAGVRHLFTLSGNQILSIYDATVGRNIALVHTRHEAAAVHMADGWGRMTETPGVALVTAGPGHLNAIAALYTARLAESPLVLLSGHAPRGEVGRGAFQELDQVGVARPVAKAAWLAEDPARLAEDVSRALALAVEWPPGPVHLSLPVDVLETRLPAAARPGGIVATPASDLPDSVIRPALDVMASAARPLILVGPATGRARQWSAVTELSDVTGAPALLMDSPRGLNDPALRGAVAALGAADAVLLLGKRLDFSLRFGQSPSFAAGCRFVELPGDPAAAAHQLIVAARGRAWGSGGWAKEVETARRSEPPAWAELRGGARGSTHPLAVCAALEPYLAAGGVFVSDGGEFGQWAQAALSAEVRLINGLSGSIGSGVPLALGAQLAAPGRRVFVTLGDGTFGFHALELDTAVRHRLPIVAVVGNDARWNAEHQLQQRRYGPDRLVGCELLPSRYDLIATALGGHGELVEDAADLAPALERAVRSGRPACVNVRIDGAPAPTFEASR